MRIKLFVLLFRKFIQANDIIPLLGFLVRTHTHTRALIHIRKPPPNKSSYYTHHTHQSHVNAGAFRFLTHTL